MPVGGAEFGERRPGRELEARRWTPAWCLLLCALPAMLFAHPAPFSYLDIHPAAAAPGGRLVVHTIDLAHDLGLEAPEVLTDEETVRRHLPAIERLLEPRLRFELDGERVTWTIAGARPLADQDAVEIDWRLAGDAPPGHLGLSARLFPYDANHQTFVTVYEGGRVVSQAVLTGDRTQLSIYTGSTQGRLTAFRHFLASGFHHILIGPDHVLFVVGLLLPGGSLLRLLGIVTAFTIGHSLTLALAALDLVAPPARLVEPVIALSIMFVGADNLLAGERGRDVRVWIALVFGLVHGFGFAGVLREIGLPPSALGISLLAFNLGVEIGQAAIVVLAAAALNALRTRRPALGRGVAVGGSIVVLAAGAFWFVERVFG